MTMGDVGKFLNLTSIAAISSNIIHAACIDLFVVTILLPNSSFGSFCLNGHML